MRVVFWGSMTHHSCGGKISNHVAPITRIPIARKTKMNSSTPPPNPELVPYTTLTLEDGEECSICTEIMLVRVQSTRCIHQFHQVCLDTWLMFRGNSPTCPVCRTSLPPIPRAPRAPIPRQSLISPEYYRRLYSDLRRTRQHYLLATYSYRTATRADLDRVRDFAATHHRLQTPKSIAIRLIRELQHPR